jgi:hypothetical protein
MSFGLSLLGNYTWSKCLSDQHAPQNSQYNVGYRAQWLPGFGIKGDYALCDGDATDLSTWPEPTTCPSAVARQFGASMSKPADLIVGGWVINGFYTFQSGQPLTVTCPNATSADFGCAANLVSGQGLYAGPHNYTQWLNPSAFAQPPVATAIGQSIIAPLGGPLQQVRGPHFANLDSSILKNFNFTESAYLQFRAEAFNTTNTPPFAQPGQLNFQQRLQQHLGHEEQQPEQWRPHAAARAQTGLLRHCFGLPKCLSFNPASGAASRSGCGPFFLKQNSKRTKLAIIADAFRPAGHSVGPNHGNVVYVRNICASTRRLLIRFLCCRLLLFQLSQRKSAFAQQHLPPRILPSSISSPGHVRGSENQSYVKVPFAVPARHRARDHHLQLHRKRSSTPPSISDCSIPLGFAAGAAATNPRLPSA